MTEIVTVADEAPSPTRHHAAYEPIRSDLLSTFPRVIHGVTNRVRGLGSADGNVGYGAPRDRSDAWAMRQLWAKAIGIDAKTIVGLRQVHGSGVRVVTVADAGKGATPGSDPVDTADALITKDSGVTLMTLHADCLPILVFDPDIPAIASIHSGWRGTVEDVAGETVRALRTALGSDPSHLFVFFGPSIGPCCYEVGPEVADSWTRRAGQEAADALVRGNSNWMLDLRSANRHLLTMAGVHSANIEVSDVCTKCSGDQWFSHRGQGAGTGRFAAFIALAGAVE
jgi:YfiH family protein